MMDCSVEFYELENGVSSVLAFLDRLKSSDPDDFTAVLAGLAKLRNRRITGSLYLERLVKGFMNCVMWVSSIPACSGFS